MNMGTSNMFGGLLFGAVGLAAFMIGKKQADWKKMTVGILLMAFTYFIQNTAAVYLIGGLLTVTLFFCRD